MIHYKTWEIPIAFGLSSATTLLLSNQTLDGAHSSGFVRTLFTDKFAFYSDERVKWFSICVNITIATVTQFRWGSCDISGDVCCVYQWQLMWSINGDWLLVFLDTSKNKRLVEVWRSSFSHALSKALADVCFVKCACLHCTPDNELTAQPPVSPLVWLCETHHLSHCFIKNIILVCSLKSECGFSVSIQENCATKNALIWSHFIADEFWFFSCLGWYSTCIYLTHLLWYHLLSLSI